MTPPFWSAFPWLVMKGCVCGRCLCQGQAQAKLGWYGILWQQAGDTGPSAAQNE